MVHQEVKLVLVILVVNANFIHTTAGVITWNEPQHYLDALVRNALAEDSWKDASSPGESTEGHQLAKELPPKFLWPATSEVMKRWLNNHLKSSLLARNQLTDSDYDSVGQYPVKRNAGGYMCHFKLCQLGASASSSGKRRWNPMAD